MSQKYLHQLLEEDQEPFLLKNYISDRRNQLKITTINKIQNSNSTFNFNINPCKNNASCFFSFPETPDFRKSPLFELTSPVKSPCKSSRTAALLLEAALRIQKHSSSLSSSSSSSSSNHKTKTKGFGLFGSLFKRIKQRNQNRKREIETKNVFVKDILSSKKFESQKINKGKPLETETSCSGYSERIIHEGCTCYQSSFSESPFRFVLQTSSCSGSHTPELASPSRHITEDKGSKVEAKSINQFQSGEEEEEDKEQCSPVCVLDPPFEDDEEGHINDDDDEDGGGFDLERSYARARQQILYNLRRFEKLAGLDPLELEKRMMEDEEDVDETYMEEDDVEDEESEVSCKENDFKELVFEAVYLSMVHDRQQMPQQFKKLIHDLIVEEEREFISLEDRDMVITRICKRVESWKEVESNTIDMMIEEDFSIEDGGWKKNVEQIRNMAGELEFDIFSILVEEFSEELVC
ncbi:uncharacterized protein LOC127125681 [Lathyrus oleraceus]|uniref:DUF4378 domain-containing protein n=1 Tax=Pisum sativum TaxID=3888 RepID=A0A9D4XS56_PEA|nr:uncharacterized protein LOC127125681 [Pisum sativum]KAI5425562.1 hypothetical protein KIW84_031387 [Pisum sativum]